MVVLTAVLGVFVIGLLFLVVIVPSRVMRREGSMHSDDRARVLLGEDADGDSPRAG